MKMKLVAASFIFVNLFTGCTDNAKKFFGKHQIQIPFNTKNYDFSVQIKGFDGLTNPSVHYLDYYPSTLEIYRNDDGKLSGQFTMSQPEYDRTKIYPHKLEILEYNFTLSDLRIENDTLKFLMQYAKLNEKYFKGWVVEKKDGRKVVAITKQMFPNLHRKRCSDNVMRETEEYLCFISNPIIDKKIFYECQLDSLKAYLNINQKDLNDIKTDMNYLNKMVQ